MVNTTFGLISILLLLSVKGVIGHIVLYKIDGFESYTGAKEWAQICNE